MTDKKKTYSESEISDMEIPEAGMPHMGMPMMNGMCPMMYNCPMMCPMMQMQGMGVPMQNMEDMRDIEWYEEWYEEDDSDYSSDESDELPYFWGPYQKHKHAPFPFFWPGLYPFAPYHKKHKK